MYEMLRIDIESRSALKLGTKGTCSICGTGCKGHGANGYAEHFTTDFLCIAAKPDDYQLFTWVNPWVLEKIQHLIDADPNPPYIISTDRLNALITQSKFVEAHNSGFETPMFHHHGPRLGIEYIPQEKWSCSMSKSLYRGLPGDLERAAMVCGAPVQKNMAGNEAMLRVCKPRNPTKADKAACPDWDTRLFWNESPEDLYTTVKYCGDDVLAQYYVSKYCGKLPDKEREIWLLDQQINARGAMVDYDLAVSAESMAAIEKAEINEAFQAAINVTTVDPATGIMYRPYNPQGIYISSPSSHKAFCKWVNSHGVETEGVGKEVVEQLIEEGAVPQWMIPILLLRQDYTKSSSSKYSAARRRVSSDGRLRGEFGFGKAHTMRWASMGVQLHNMPSMGLLKNAHKLVDFVKQKQVELCKATFGSIMLVLKSCIRSVFLAGMGHRFICGDFAAIEGRVLAWMADEHEILQAYRDGLDMYKIAAMAVFNIAYEDVTKTQRAIGKVIELACGYQGWLGAFRSMAAKFGVEISDEDAEDAIGKWRKKRWLTKKLWADTQKAAIATVQTGVQHTAGKVTFWLDGRWLKCRLPSGRDIHFFDPKVSGKVDNYGREKLALSYWTIKEGQWCRVWTYGGKLVENITQAIARDLLAESMLDLDAVNYPIVIHVHDEACAEVKIGMGSKEHFEEVMGQDRWWAPGLPLKVEAWEGLRYRK